MYSQMLTKELKIWPLKTFTWSFVFFQEKCAVIFILFTLTPTRLEFMSACRCLRPLIFLTYVSLAGIIIGKCQRLAKLLCIFTSKPCCVFYRWVTWTQIRNGFSQQENSIEALSPTGQAPSHPALEIWTSIARKLMTPTSFVGKIQRKC